MFRGALKAALDNIHKALAELLPTARATGSPLESRRSTCLSCEQHVRTNADVVSMLSGERLPHGTPMRRRIERAVSPERVASPAGMLPRRPISSGDPLGALMQQF